MVSITSIVNYTPGQVGLEATHLGCGLSSEKPETTASADLGGIVVGRELKRRAGVASFLRL